MEQRGQVLVATPTLVLLILGRRSKSGAEISLEMGQATESCIDLPSAPRGEWK